MAQRRVTKIHNGRIGAIGAAAVIALMLSSCSPSSGDESGNAVGELTTVDLAISVSSAMSAAPFAVAQNLGYFEENGCQIGEQLEGQGGSDPLRAVIDGGLDMGEVATNAVIEGYLAGADVTIVGSSHQLPYDFTYAVRAGSGITSIKDLAGKTLGYTNPGSATEDIAYLMADAVGLGLDEFELVPTSGMGGGIAMLEGGQVDAALMIPLVFERQDPGVFEIGFEGLDVIEAYQKTVYVASDTFLKENPDGVRCVLAGLHKAMQFIQDDPEAAAKIYADFDENYEYEAILADLKFANSRDTLSGGVGFNRVGLENVSLARQLRTGEATPVSWSELVDVAYLPEGASSELPE